MKHIVHDVQVTLDELEVPFTKGRSAATRLAAQQLPAKIDELDLVGWRNEAKRGGLEYGDALRRDQLAEYDIMWLMRNCASIGRPWSPCFWPESENAKQKFSS